MSWRDHLQNRPSMSWRDHISRSPRAMRMRLALVKWLLKTPFVAAGAIIGWLAVNSGGFIDGAGGPLSPIGGVAFLVLSALLVLPTMILLYLLGFTTNPELYGIGLPFSLISAYGMVYYSRSLGGPEQ